jgi:octaprenyl-diphosphate synthase
MKQTPAGRRRLLSPLSGDALKAHIKTMKSPVDEALRQTLKSQVALIEEVGQYILFSDGKRLRPILFLLISRLLGRPAPPWLSAVFEYLHAASLLHDDVVDNSSLRRGQPAAQVKYGNPEVILVGDFLFATSYHLASTHSNPIFASALARCSAAMAQGQVLELTHNGELLLDYQIYEDIIIGKTAALIATACHMAAIYAEQPDETGRAMYQYGMHLGIAFQMVDDALDVAASAGEMGKNVGHDLREGKITLPFILARDALRDEKKEALLALALKASSCPQSDLQAREMIIKAGGVRGTMEMALNQACQAQKILKSLNLPPGQDLDLLYSLAAYVVNRRN